MAKTDDEFELRKYDRDSLCVDEKLIEMFCEFLIAACASH